MELIYSADVFDFIPPDPDDIGSSEYRAIYEVLEASFDKYADPAENLELAEAILAEFIEHAQGLQRELGLISVAAMTGAGGANPAETTDGEDHS
jgi:20S proteasome alpha/beta subunit